MPNQTSPPARPVTEIHQLADLLKPYAKEHFIKAKVKIHLNPHNELADRKVIILTDGKAALYRRENNLLLTYLSPVSIFGVAEIFAPFAINYFRAETDCLVHAVSAADVVAVLDEHNAWKTMNILLSYYIQHLVYRDLKMVGNSTYHLIKSCIYEYHVLPDEIKKGQSLSNYIQNKTALSRSLVMKVLYNLKTGGYIEISKGRLTQLSKLPNNY